MITRSLAPAPSPGFHHLHHHHRHVQYHHQHSIPAPSPITIATSAAASAANGTHDRSTSPPYNSKLQAVDFSPPLIAMVVVVATAFFVITYSRLISRHLLRLLRRWRRWRRRRRRRYLPSSNGDLDSPPPLFDSPENFHVYSPYGLDDSVIKTIPLSVYTTKSSRHSFRRDCAVCLLEFEDDDYIRTLPVCSHAFHVDCIDIWLRSHANCPLCRAGVFRPESPFIPVMAARIRPSLDDAILLNTINSIPLVDQQHAIISQTPTAAPAAQSTPITEITPCIEEEPSRRNSSSNFIYSYSEDHRFNNGGGGRGDMVLKRSYSFGFERSFLASDRMLVTEPATASPWRYRRGGGGGGGSSFWTKRPSPFGSLSKARVFSFRYYRGMKSPFFRRRGGFFPLSERFSASGGGGGSSRRSKSMASPMFLRSSVAAFSSSRLRCGDPEALLSPERLSSRR